jgi:carboxyl-terminal processing protease
MLMRMVAIGLALSSACAAADLTSAQRQANIDSFEYVWKTVKEKHWDPKMGGVDWQAVHDELLPKVEKAKNASEARDVMSDMLSRLHQTHYGVFPAEVYKEFDAPGSTEGEPGIDVRVLEGHAIVTAVMPNSPAATQGVKPGWEIVRVDGRDVAPVLKKILDNFKDSTLLDLRLSRSVLGRLSGSVGTPVHIDFLDGADHRVKLDVYRAMPRGTVAKLGYLPPFYFWVDAKKARPDIGYVQFNAFFDPDTLIKAFSGAVKDCGSCSGFVVDLRGNPGGLGVLAMGVAGWFVDKSGLQLGTMLMQGTALKFVVFPRPEPFQGPLAVLVDGSSASTSEIFAGGLKDLNRARIFGTRTAGAALPSVFDTLPNGDGFQYAMANYISQGGKPLEGIGVTPDEEVKLTRHQLLEGQDPVLEAAVRWIEKQKQ